MNNRFSLGQFNQVLLALLLFFTLLYLGSSFIVPVAIGGLFAMLLVPACRFLEKWHLPRIVAALICVLTIVVVLVFTTVMVFNQLAALATDLPELGQRLSDLVDRGHQFVQQNLEVPREKQNEYLQQGLENSVRFAGAYLTTILLFAGNLIIDFIIVMSYTLLFLLYRRRLKRFIFQLTSRYDTNAHTIVSKITDVASSYISGVFLVVLILTTVNTIGLMVIGIEHALLFGLMAGILNIIPYLGSIAGSLIPVLFALLTKDSLITPVVVVIFFLVVQQIESYVLTPNITGAKIKLNPMATLMVLLLGGAVWGVAGMILFVPYLGILKVIFDHVDKLNPYGFIMGKEDQ